MVRYTIDQGHIQIAFGNDDISGVFLSVSDNRLKYREDAPDEVNAVSESIGIKDGGGSYFDLHTGQHGFGIKVDDATMATYLSRYGVTSAQIASLPLKIPITYYVGEKMFCCVDCQTGELKCGKCLQEYYCSKECQKKSWSIHKLFCHPAKESKQKYNLGSSSPDSLVAYLLPETLSEMEPQLVKVPFKKRPGRYQDDKAASSGGPDISEFCRNPSSKRSDWFQGDNKDIPFAYHIFFNENGMRECKLNEMILKIYKKVKFPSSSFWHGNVLLFKAKRKRTTGDVEYENMTLRDVKYALEFLLKYSE